MPDELVRDFWLNYLIGSNKVNIWINTAESGWKLVNQLPPEQAVFLSDMLRNGKPIFYIPGTSLHTKEEPPGEAE